MTKNLYWHFVAKDKRLGYGDGRIVKVGRTYKVKGQPVLCRYGLHASKSALDTLLIAPGPIVCKVTLGGIVIHSSTVSIHGPLAGDKSVATERTVVAMADATEVLRKFARLCALDVIHKWDAPDVVVKYLKTGDESLRLAAIAAIDPDPDPDAVAARAAVARDDPINAADSAARAARCFGGVAREKQSRRLTRMLNELTKKG